MRHVVLLTSDKLSPWQRLQDGRTRVSAIAKPKYIGLYEGAFETHAVDDVANFTQAAQVLQNILSRNPVDQIVTPIERAVLTGGFLRSYFDLPGLSFEATQRVSNKVRMKQHFAAHGFRTPKFLPLNRIEDIPEAACKLQWPVILKPAIGSGSMNTHRIDSRAHFETLLAEGVIDSRPPFRAPMILESCIEIQNEYHVDSVVRTGKVVFASVSRVIEAALEPKPCSILNTLGGFCGSHILAEADPIRERLLELNRCVVESFALGDGVTHFEVLDNGAELLAGEIAVRPGGGGVVDAIRIHHGVDLWQAFVDPSGEIWDASRVRCRPAKAITGWYGLPARNGLIADMTPKETLQALPGVLELDLHYRAGQTVQDKTTSVFYVGVLYFHFESESELIRLNRALRDRYYLNVEAVAQ